MSDTLSDKDMEILREAFDLADKIGTCFKNEKLAVIHTATAVVLEFLVRHTELDFDLFIASVKEFQRINDQRPEEDAGSVKLGIMGAKSDPSN